jgi:uncharacterized protein
MTIRIRPHHLLCMLSYVGKGYTPPFTANYDRIARRLSDGETLVIVDGPDDICAPLLSEKEPHCWRDSVVERDKISARDVARLLGFPIQPSALIRLDHAFVERMRVAFAAGQTRHACMGCEWRNLCSTIADTGFEGARLLPPIG